MEDFVTLANGIYLLSVFEDFQGILIVTVAVCDQFGQFTGHGALEPTRNNTVTVLLKECLEVGYYRIQVS